MARTEKDFLNTLETYVKITQDRLRDGRIIDAHDELGLIEIMIDQRRQEVEGAAPWEKIREKTEPTLEALKEHPWKSHYSLEEMIERQVEPEEDRCADEVAEEILENECQYERYYDGKRVEPERDYGAEMLKKLTE